MVTYFNLIGSTQETAVNHQKIIIQDDFILQSSYKSLQAEPAIPNKVEDIDYLVNLNGNLRYTSKYHLMGEDPPQLVVRRGKTFGVNVKFTRPFNKEKDHLTISAVWTDIANESKIYKYSMDCNCAHTFNIAKKLWSWSAILFKIRKDGLWASIVLSPPNNCLIGKFYLIINTIWEGEINTFKAPMPIYMLFNPWHSSDTAYLPNSIDRADTVLNDVGIIYRGISTSIESTTWKYGQFDKDVLLAVLTMISKFGELEINNWSNCLSIIDAVAKAISSIIENDDNTNVSFAPYGSAYILNQWYETDLPVKYGCCYVNSGIMTTAYRALGICARAVTGYDFGINADQSYTIDFFYLDDFNERLKYNNYKPEASYCYHTWCEVFMKRTDIDEKYSGWQAVESDAGPCPVRAVKTANLDVPWDADYFYSGLNSDVRIWKVRKGKPLRLMGRETERIGTYVTTKGFKLNKIIDLTPFYHDKKQMTKERVLLATTLRNADEVYNNFEKNPLLKDIYIKLRPTKNVKFGDSVIVSVHIKNFSHSSLEAEFCLQAVSFLNSGHPKELIKSINISIVVKRGATQELKLVVGPEEYFKYLVDDWLLKVYASASLPKCYIFVEVWNR
ncbi:annulin-like isoform X2 [Cimex lectularius]|uniref:Transglutaminase-like domain-containing protein n=1 Tax=Cimex lectularius TaxID=79782 RepID=A0A8I6RGU1_CIMLE|nr:annulin-like isoform X2 [Cimex lectularius]